tara:strand:+ start:1685 stop:2470 length:786 start_codon:yes stop_codon:yes gene_type:complete
MKLLLENWRKYLNESERADAASAEFEKILKTEMPAGSWASVGPEPGDKAHGAPVAALKRIYKKYADHSFLNGLSLVHWTDRPDLFLGGSSKDQISAEGYLPENKIESHWGTQGVGILLDGYVVIAHDRDSYSETDPSIDTDPVTIFQNILDDIFGSRMKSSRKLRKLSKKTSGFTKRTIDVEISNIIFDAETFGRYYGNLNEFIVDNWKPVAMVIISSGNIYYRDEDKIAEAIKIAQKYNLPIIDENQNPIELEDSNETPT